jgi:hypothetical protein
LDEVSGMLSATQYGESDKYAISISARYADNIPQYSLGKISSRI